MRLLFNVVLLLCLPVLAAKAQGISLKQEKVAYTPNGFYINDVADDRADSKNDGLAGALKAFVAKNVSQNNKAQAVVLHIVSFKNNIKTEGSVSQVDATLVFGFYVAGKRVVQYNARSSGSTDKDPAAFVEKFVRQTLENNLEKFGDWWAHNKSEVPTNSVVKANVIIGQTVDQPNSIVYSQNRPLQIADFTGRPEASGSELAITASAIAIKYSGETDDGQFTVNVTIVPYFQKQNSWFKNEGKIPRVLAHEQAHFEITAIKACELADAIRKTDFTEKNYEQVIDQLYRQTMKKDRDEEDLYDSETNHGIIADQQAIWQNKVKEQIKSVGCY